MTLLAAVLGGVLSRECFPVKVVTPATPIITTVHDTVHDTLKIQQVIRPPAKVTTDTVQLVIRETIHDTSYINVSPDTAQRTRVWPVVALRVGAKVGDTTLVGTFNLRNGRGAISQIYTPGPLLGVWADSLPTPRLLWGQAVVCPGPSLGQKGKYAAIGAGVFKVAEGIAALIRR